MIAACPKCEAKYRVDEAKIGPDGARLRCAKCQAVFRVRAPGAASAPRPAPAGEARPSAPAAPATTKAPAPTVVDTGSPTLGEPQYDGSRLVLVADPKLETGKLVVGALASWGMQTILVHDGVEAMLTIQRARPRLVVLDAALPKMYGFQVCEVVKRNESLRDTRVVLVGAIHNSDRYRRPPSDLYGADWYLEQPDLPGGLLPLLKQLGMRVDETASAPAAQSPAPARPAAGPPVRASSPPARDDGLAAEREKAERLARIVVSDIVLYQGDKFEQAIHAGNLLEVLDSEIEEGRGFFRQRIDERIRNEKDHLVEELLRVARERGMR